MSGRRVLLEPQDREGAWAFRGNLPVEVDGREVLVHLSVQGHVVTPRDAGPETFAHRPHDEWLSKLSSAPIASISINKGGTALSLRLSLEGRLQAIYKPQQTHSWSSPRKEVAAYRIDRRLGLNAVPPCVLRPLRRDVLFARLSPRHAYVEPRVASETVFDADGCTHGSAALWIPDLTESGLDTLREVAAWSRALGGEGDEEPEAILVQLSSLLLFDVVIDNHDRFSGGALLSSPDREMLYAIDNSVGFGEDAIPNDRCWTLLRRCKKFSARFVEALRRLDGPSLDTHDVLSAREGEAVVARARRALAYVDELISERGRSSVLVFP